LLLVWLRGCRQEVTECGLSRLITSSVHLCDESLTHFIKALVLCRDPLLEAHPHGGTAPQVPHCPFSERLCTRGV
jgi:hypothetical protein